MHELVYTLDHVIAKLVAEGSIRVDIYHQICREPRYENVPVSSSASFARLLIETGGLRRMALKFPKSARIIW